MEWRRRLEEIDPKQSDAPRQFNELLRWIYELRSYSYRELVNRSVKNKEENRSATTLSIGSISTNLRGDSLPSGDFMRTFLTVTGFTASEIEEWTSVRADIMLRCDNSKLPETEPTGPIINRLQDELVRLKQHADELGAQKLRLENDLADEVEKRTALAAEIEELRAELATARRHVDDLDRELQSRLAVKQLERSQVETHIGKLRVELRVVADEEVHTIRLHDNLRDQVESLEEADRSRSELIDLHFQRAEYERRNREQADKKVEAIEERLRQVERLLGEYQSQQMHESAAGPHGELSVPQNNAVHVELVALPEDFGTVQTVRVTFTWYCQSCERGGERSSVVICPHCGESVARGCPREIPLSLPSRPCYGKTIRLLGLGHYDEPAVPPGDVYVMVVR
jgi:DNA repair exonuclease SbcCD ATPase subunit